MRFEQADDILNRDKGY